MTAELSMECIEKILRRAIAAAPALPARDSENLEVLLQAGEWLVGYELVCEELYEYSIILDEELIAQLAEVGLALGAEDGYASILRGNPFRPSKS